MGGRVGGGADGEKVRGGEDAVGEFLFWAGGAQLESGDERIRMSGGTLEGDGRGDEIGAGRDVGLGDGGGVIGRCAQNGIIGKLERVIEGGE